MMKAYEAEHLSTVWDAIDYALAYLDELDRPSVVNALTTARETLGKALDRAEKGPKALLIVPENPEEPGDNGVEFECPWCGSVGGDVMEDDAWNMWEYTVHRVDDGYEARGHYHGMEGGEGGEMECRHCVRPVTLPMDKLVDVYYV
jgi:hypothetical protein